MRSRPHSLSNHSAFHRALIAVVCVAMVFVSGSSSTLLAGTDWLARPIDDRIEQIEAPNHTAAATIPLDILRAEDLLDELVEPAEPSDDDETKHYVPRFDVAAFGSQTGLYESADRALTPFRLLAFPSRGSPSA